MRGELFGGVARETGDRTLSQWQLHGKDAVPRDVADASGEREVGCFAAKVVYDKAGGERALTAFRSARLESGVS